MAKRRDIRRLAMQVLYQLDLRGEADAPMIREGLAEGPDAGETAEAGFTLALAAWKGHGPADEMATELAPQWPTHRQPPVDRAILRLAHHEMVTGRSPAKVAINEAVELAKEFCSQQSPAFVNGVLDKMAKRLDAEGKIPAQAPADPWLADALGETGEPAKD